MAVGLALGIAGSMLLEMKIGTGAVIAGMMAAFICGKSGKHKPAARVLCFFFAAFVLGSLLCGMQTARLDRQEAALLGTRDIRGVVVSSQKKGDEHVQLTVKVLNAWELPSGKPCEAGKNAKILVNVYGETEDHRALEGMEIRLRGEAYAAQGRRNPNCFDYHAYLRTKGICCVMSAASGGCETVGVRSRALHGLAKVRSGFIERLPQERAGVLEGLLFGDKGSMDEELYAQFQHTGTAHVLTVSGLHMGFAFALITRALGRRRDLKTCGFKAAMVLLYAALAGFSPSVVRACGMMLISIAASYLHMRYDVLCAAAAVAVCTLTANPLMLFNTGFQMSYLAILTLVLVGGRLKKYCRGMLMPSLCIQIGLSPYVAYSFNYFSFTAVIANVPIVFIAGVIVPLGILGVIVSVLPRFAAADAVFNMLSKSMDMLVNLMIRCNETAYMDGDGFTYCTSPKIFTLVLFYGILFFAVSEGAFILWKRKRFRLIGAVAAGILVLSVTAWLCTASPLDKASLVFVDVGQGDCLHVRTRDGKNILIDGGGSSTYDVGKNTLLPYLLKNGVSKIDLAIVTHMHTDHCGAIGELGRYMEISEIALYEGYRASESATSEAFPYYRGEFLYLKSGDSLLPSRDVTIDILYPPAGQAGASGSDENAMSLIARVRLEGISVLMTADIDAAGERLLMAHCAKAGYELSSDILKVPHHGSKYSSSEEFIAAVNPKAAIIQCGKNNFGHPAESTIEKYAKNDIMVYVTKECGAVGIYGTGKGKCGIAAVIGDQYGVCEEK